MHPLAQESTPRHIHALVRLLKAPSDPPSAGGPSKIDFAYRAWSDRSFAAANKTEVLIEWILSSFARDGKRCAELTSPILFFSQFAHFNRDDRVDHPSSLNPIAEPKYWSLLQETLSFASSASSVRPLKVWLLPLLYRVNLAGIVTELLTFSHAQNVRDDINLSAIYTPARAAIAILWPLAEKRVGMDALMECFAAVLDVCARRGAGVERATNGVVTQTYEADLTWICATVVGSYRDAFANFGNKKKVSGLYNQTYTSFLATHLPVWVRSLAPPSVIHPQPVQDNPIRHIPKQLEDALYIAGTDTLFSLDALKQPLDIFLDAFARACTNHGLTILPRLFATRLTAVNRHRTSLFPSPSGSGPSALVMREAVRADAMATWESCWKSLLQGALMSEGDQSVQEQGQAGTGKVDAWVTLVGILDIIEKERLFVSNAMLGPTNVQNVADNDSQPALTAAREYALVIVERANEVDFDAACSESSFLMVSLAVSVLDVLVKIEYELVGGILGSVLSAVLRFPPALSTRTKDAVERLLSDVLDYHSKTRTVHTYALALLSALSSQPSDLPSLSQSRATSAHDSMSSPLRTHLSSLLRALRVALTPTQSIALGPAVLDELRRTWSTYTAEASKSTRRKKKQKVNDENALDTRDTVRQHLHRSFEEAFVQTALVAGSVLSNLSPSVYAADTQTVVWDDARKLGWEVVWACLRLGTWRELSPITTERGDENKKDKQKKRKRHQELDHVKKDGSFMSDHAVASAALRFLHDVRAGFARAMNSSMPTMLGESEVEELLSIAMDEGTAPGRWCGSSRTLTREAFGVALLHILVDRWMDVIDSRASEDVLQKFVSLLLSTCMVPPSTPVDILDNSQYSPRYLTPFGILCRVLHNAQFWELHNIQSTSQFFGPYPDFLCLLFHLLDAFLSNVLKSTVPLSSYTLHLCSGSSLSTMSTLLSDLDLARASEVYTLLMHVPPEYFTRSSRAELMKRAIGGDVGVCRVRDSGSRESVDNGKKPKKKKDKDDASHISHVESEIPVDHDTSIVRSCSVDWLRYLTMFRAFLRRMALSADVLDHNASRAYIEHLLDTPSNLSTDALMAVTLDLVILHLTALFRSQSPEAAASITGIVTRISDLKLFSPPSSQEPVKHILTSVVFHLIECLRDDFQRTSFASNILESLKMLYESLTPFLYRSDDVIPDGASALDLSSHAELRYHALSLAEWLGVDGVFHYSPHNMLMRLALRSKYDTHWCELGQCPHAKYA
ncbi:hypothetical protein ID866_5018 [Astraeus odoratus]|nr:hypothetical protein ID866_5018 [Astraeus odoratus]